MCKPLEGRVAVVTGSSRGIGREIALHLARQGAAVVIHYRADYTAASESASQLRALGSDHIVSCADLRSPQDIQRLFQEVKDHYSRLDILVSNAALGAVKPAMQLAQSKWDMTMEISARAFLLCAQCAVPLMKSGGRIVAISSLGSRRYIPGYIAIGCAKAALESMTRYLAVELAEKGILVNAVCGGLIETSTLNHFPERQRILSDCIARTPWKRVGQPEDIAKVVAFLCTPESNWVCGQTITVDGGFSLV